MSETTISARSRNLGYGWNNHPTTVHLSGGQTALAVPPPSEPRVTGGLRSIEREYSRAAELNNSNDWADSLFVGGRRVTAVWQDNVPVFDPHDTAILPRPRSYTSGWYTFRIGEILRDLRSGNEAKVRLAD